YWYANLAVDVGSFTLAYGLHEDDLAHVDVTYSYNDNVSFTLSKVVDNVSDTYNDEIKFMVSASLPIKF
ncbi:MAG: histidine kinase, partial [Thiohalomonadaceae bacterium]